MANFPSLLGVPLFIGKPKFIHLQPIPDRILGKIAIVHNMLLFSFYVYLWPINLLNQLDCGLRNFIWFDDVKVKKLVIIAWHKVCSPAKEGGLGLRSIKAINQVVLLKMTWKMQTSSHDWAIIFRNIFVRDSRPTRAYINWQKIVENSIWLVGNGRKINLWLDNWIGVSLAESLNIPHHMQSYLSAKFSTLRDFNVSIKYSNAPNIIEVVWFPPTLGRIKINTNGATYGSPGHVGGGEIFRDNSGEILGYFANYMSIQDSLYAELFSAILAIKIAYVKG
ncbi:hypothetical protein Lal_00011514 [Lupinus albus]|nr:hypothetical protein Lal_00011514 [Lupinus albus]